MSLVWFNLSRIMDQ